MRRPRVDLTKKQVKYIKANYHKVSNAQMAKKFNINFSTFSSKLHDLGLFRMKLQYWTDEQAAFLKRNYKKIGDKELAILFNGLWDKEPRWTWKHMEKKRMYLKLKRTKEEVKAIKIRNTLRGCWLGTSTWKTRGVCKDGTIRIWQHSWAVKYGRRRCAFKAIKVDGVFVNYAHWLYEKTFGPLPAGYVIGFKDRDNMNVVIENIEAITRAEHARRNAQSRYPEDIRNTLKLLNQLNTIIKHKTYEYKTQGKQQRQYSY